MGRSIAGLLNRRTQRPAYKLPVPTAQVSLSDCEKDQLMADSPMLSRSGGMRTQLYIKKKVTAKVPLVGPKELYKAPLIDHIRGGFELLA